MKTVITGRVEAVAGVYLEGVAKVIETVFVGEECWRAVDNEAFGPCTDCGISEYHLEDEFGGFETLSFGYVPDAEPVRKHELNWKEVLCTNCFDRVCEEAVTEGKAIERHDGFFVGAPGLDMIVTPAI